MAGTGTLHLRRPLARPGGRASPARRGARLRLRVRHPHRGARFAHRPDGLCRRDRAPEARDGRAAHVFAHPGATAQTGRHDRRVLWRAHGARHRRLAPGDPWRTGTERGSSTRSPRCANTSTRCGPCSRAATSPSGSRFPTKFRFMGLEPRPDLPIYIAALSPNMLRLAGEIADGAMLWLCNPEYIRRVVVPEVTRRTRAGREEPGGIRHRRGDSIRGHRRSRGHFPDDARRPRHPHHQRADAVAAVLPPVVRAHDPVPDHPPERERRAAVDAEVAQRVRGPGRVAPQHEILAQQPHPQRRLGQRVGVRDRVPALPQRGEVGNRRGWLLDDHAAMIRKALPIG